MKKTESNRRKLIKNHDEKLSIHHFYNFNIAKKYIVKKDILDIGCWTGAFLNLAKNDAKSLSGIDPGVEAIRVAKKLVPKGNFKIGEAQNLSFKNKSFDTVTLLEVLEHVPAGNEQKVITEIHRVLRPKGHLILSTPNNNIISILGDPAYFLIGHRHYSMSYLEKLLKSNGFKIIWTHKTGGFIRILTINIELIAKHLFKKSITQWPTFIDNIIKGEYKKGGFFENHLIAQKIT